MWLWTSVLLGLLGFAPVVAAATGAVPERVPAGARTVRVGDKGMAWFGGRRLSAAGAQSGTPPLLTSLRAWHLLHVRAPLRISLARAASVRDLEPVLVVARGAGFTEVWVHADGAARPTRTRLPAPPVPRLYPGLEPFTLHLQPTQAWAGRDPSRGVWVPNGRDGPDLERLRALALEDARLYAPVRRAWVRADDDLPAHQVAATLAMLEGAGYPARFATRAGGDGAPYRRPPVGVTRTVETPARAWWHEEGRPTVRWPDGHDERLLLGTDAVIEAHCDVIACDLVVVESGRRIRAGQSALGIVQRGWIYGVPVQLYEGRLGGEVATMGSFEVFPVTNESEPDEDDQLPNFLDTLPSEVVEAAIPPSVAAACAELRPLGAGPSETTIELGVRPDGSLFQVLLRSYHDRRVGKCLEDAVQEVLFPPLPGGRLAMARYRVVFQ